MLPKFRKKLFKSSAINKVSRRFFEGLTQVGLGGIKSHGLFIGDFIGNFANVLSGLFQINRKSKIRIDQISVRKMKFVAHKFRDFPLFNLGPTLLSSIANIIPFILINYIKDHQLENKENSKFISPDEKLKNLLCLKDDDELTYFTIQKYMNKHFISKGDSSITT